MPQYFVENSHPAIISKETFQAVQREMKRLDQLRKDQAPSRYTNRYPFSGKIVCGGCGKKFTRKYWSTGKYKKPIWICRTRIENGKKAFMRVVHLLLIDKDALVSEMLENIVTVFRKQTSWWTWR